jgi:mannitol-1-/sugar-/sorbitol-6-phosphatase
MYLEMQSIAVQGILFDLDGVLVDSTPCVTRVWAQWAVEQGLDPEYVVKVAHGRRAIETVQFVAPKLDSAAELVEIERRELADMEGLTVIPGAVDLLQSIPTDRWTVVTSGTRALASERLRVAGLPIPKKMITADDVATGKPDPAPYLKGAMLLRMAPKDCLVIEDSPSGLRAARAAGMTSIGIPTTYASSELHDATALLTALAGLRVRTEETGGLIVSW